MCTTGAPTLQRERAFINQVYQESKEKSPNAFTHSKRECKIGDAVQESISHSPQKFKLSFPSIGPNIRQWGIIRQITALPSLANLPDQQASSSSTPLSITQATPNMERIKPHNSWAMGKWRRRWSVVSPSPLHIQHQPTTTNCRFWRLSTVYTFPKAAVQMKKLTLVGTLGCHTAFQGKDLWAAGKKTLERFNIKHLVRRWGPTYNISLTSMYNPRTDQLHK